MNERDRQTDRQTDRDKDRDRQKETETEAVRHRERQTDRRMSRIDIQSTYLNKSFNERLVHHSINHRTKQQLIGLPVFLVSSAFSSLLICRSVLVARSSPLMARSSLLTAHSSVCSSVSVVFCSALVAYSKDSTVCTHTHTHARRHAEYKPTDNQSP